MLVRSAKQYEQQCNSVVVQLILHRRNRFCPVRPSGPIIVPLCSGSLLRKKRSDDANSCCNSRRQQLFFSNVVVSLEEEEAVHHSVADRLSFSPLRLHL